MIIMGVDFGDARTGLAVCDKGEMLASPAGVISEKDFTRCQEKVAAAAKEHRAELLVVGYPKNMNGTVGERAELCQKFGDGLKELTGLPVVMWDERCTTVSAHSYLNVTNTRGKKRKAVVDAVAAKSPKPDLFRFSGISLWQYRTIFVRYHLMYAICSSVLFLIEILCGAWEFVLLPAFPDSHECCGCLPF